MKMLGHLLLVSVLIIWAELPAAALQKIRVKPGTCPRDICRCIPPPQPDKCLNDYVCEGKKKCCYFCCVRSCMDPTERPGTCPPAPRIFCNPPQRDLCDSDEQCPELQKCCRQGCRRRCVDLTKREN